MLDSTAPPVTVALPAPPRPGPRPGVVLAIVSAAVFLANLDLFIVNIAFPRISASFPDQGLGAMSWVLNGYTVVFAALLAASGRIADRYGRRRLFLGGVAVFTLASAACAAATSPAMLVAFRVVQAVGAALIIPTSLALLLGVFPPERRGAAVGAWAAVGAVAGALGPPLGGLLVGLSWRWIFLVNVPVGVAALVAGWRVLPEIRDAASGLPDLLGTTALVGGVGALALALVEAPDRGWASPRTLGVLAGAATALAVVVLRSARHPVPVLDLVALRVPRFWLACTAMLLYGTAFAAMLFGNVLFMTGVWDWSVLRAGIALAPGPAAAALASVLGARAVRRIGPGATAASGAALFGVATTSWVWWITPEPAYAALLPGLLLSGVGVGLTLPTLSGMVGSALPPARWGAGSSMINCARQIGTVIGTSAVVLFVGGGTGLHQVQAGWVFITLICTAAAAAAGGTAFTSR
jgi:EmrB/QacA subfamily drug resistance transporter